MKKNILCLIGLCLLASASMSAQVTLGSGHAPRKGALLDLKEDNQVSANSTKGLGMPRVELTSNSNLNNISGAAGKNNEHIGLVVYNVGEDITSAATRLCPGLHVWDGSKWQPLTAYPDWTGGGVGGTVGPEADLIDSRGGVTETYKTARFHALLTPGPGSIYACKQSDAPVISKIDAGVWMTENLRTQYAPSGHLIPMPGATGAGDGTQYANYSYAKTPPTTNSAGWKKVDGMYYNWAAATVGANGVNGKGGVNGKDNATNEGWAASKPIGDVDPTARIQGICPSSWHLPSAKEWRLLEIVTTSNPADYIISGSSASSTQPAFIWMAKTASNNLGASKDADKGGLAVLLTGRGAGSGSNDYGTWAYLWSSSSASSHDAWMIKMKQNLPNVEHEQGTRDYMATVRCVKD